MFMMIMRSRRTLRRWDEDFSSWWCNNGWPQTLFLLCKSRHRTIQIKTSLPEAQRRCCYAYHRAAVAEKVSKRQRVNDLKKNEEPKRIPIGIKWSAFNRCDCVRNRKFYAFFERKKLSKMLWLCVVCAFYNNSIHVSVSYSEWHYTATPTPTATPTLIISLEL